MSTPEELEALSAELESVCAYLDTLRSRCADLGVNSSLGGDPIYYASSQISDMAEVAAGMANDIRVRAEQDKSLLGEWGSMLESPENPERSERSVRPDPWGGM